MIMMIIFQCAKKQHDDYDNDNYFFNFLNVFLNGIKMGVCSDRR